MDADTAQLTVDSTTDGDAHAPSAYRGISADAFLSLGCMEGVYEPIVAPVLSDAQRLVYADSLHVSAYASFDSMEGLPGVMEPVVERAVVAEEAARAKAAFRPGYAVAAAVAIAAYAVHYLPFAPFAVATGSGSVKHPVSAAIIAIILGLAARNTMRLPESIKAGCKRIVRKMIPVAIVCTGAALNLGELAGVGLTALFITVVCIVIAVAASYYVGRLFGLNAKTSLLLGAGTGICGNSAIIAVAPLVDAEDEDVALSVGAVNLFGLVTMLLLPVIGGWFALSSEAFGIWSGTSIHAVPQVVAAGFAYSPDAGATATLVKLVRVTLLAPMVFVLALTHAKHVLAGNNTDQKLAVHYARFVPWFVWGFMALAVLNTFGMIPTMNFKLAGFGGEPTPAGVPLASALNTVGKILLTLAMAAIGLEVNVRQLAGVGIRALSAGFISSAILAAASLTLILMLV